MRKRKAFTLIELLITLVVMIILITLLVGIYTMSVKVFTSETDRSNLRQNVSGAMLVMTDLLLDVRSVEAASNRSITCWVDKDFDSSLEAGETYIFSWSGVNGASLIMSIDGSQRNLLQKVYNFTLTYDSAVVANIRDINITLNASQGAQSLTLSTSVRPRNL